MNWDDRLYYYFFDSGSSTVHLDKYSLEKKVKLDKVINLSGVTYNSERNSLFLITNNPTELIETDKAGTVISKYKLEGFKDTEGLCFMPSGELVILEERVQTLSIFNLPKRDEAIHKKDALKLIEVSVYDQDNKEFEGVSYSPEHKSFYLVKEKNPPSLLRLEYDHSSFSIKNVSDFQTPYLEDFSDIYCKSDGLLILSDESALLSETSFSGEMQSFLELDQGFNGLDSKIPQAEGVCLDDNGKLYIVSEPNLLYIYSK